MKMDGERERDSREYERSPNLDDDYDDDDDEEEEEGG